MRRDKAGLPQTKTTFGTVAIAELRSNPRNVRTHSKKQIRLIAASIQEFGFLSPVVVDEDGVVLAGHGRIEAAKLVGLTHAPVVRANQLSPQQKRAYLIADNKISEHAGWDRNRLAVELGQLIELLPAVGLDVSVTGFETGEIDLLLSDLEENSASDLDDVPAPPHHAAAKFGDVWLLGKHRLLCGDSRHADSFRRLMMGELASACFCDPPYNVKIRSVVGRGKRKHSEFAFASGEMKADEYRQFLKSTLSNAAAVSRKGSIHFVCMDWRHLRELQDAAGEVYDEMLNLIVWVKTNAGQGSFYRSQHELIACFKVAGDTHQNNVELGRFGRNRSNVWRYAGCNAFGRNRTGDLASHPTVKPVALVSDALLDCTARGDVVLDQFSGSGTLILAAEKVGRAARAIEFEPRYVDLAIMRWQELTKRDAILDGDGRTYFEIRQAQHEAQTALQPSETELKAPRAKNHRLGPGARGRE